MELRDAVRGRRMVRSFRADPLDPHLVAELFDDALRAPTAGNSRGVSWVILEGPSETDIYWTAATTPQWRSTARRWKGLSPAPVVALALASAAVYLRRYGEPDKIASGLGPPSAGVRGEDAWPVPYWFGDAAFSTMTLLLGAVDRGIGACFLGSFRGERALLDSLGVPDEWRLFGTVLLGHPAPVDPRSASLDRPRAERSAQIHRGRWGTGG
jgi:nitroreductase